MEPEERYIEPYVKPLLDQPGSTYRHTYLAGAHSKRYWDSYRQLYEDPSLLPPRPALPAGDPKLRQLDTSLLVIGNLERSYDNRRTDTASLLLHQMPYNALSNELFQRSGLVRMLWWIPERLKHHVLPRSPFLRSPFSQGIEMGAEPTEVAGVKSVQDLQDAHAHSRRRAAIYNRMAIDDVAKRMQAAGMSAPKGRELLGVDHDKGVEVTEDSHKSPLHPTATTIAELEADISKVKDRLARIQECCHNRRLRGAAKLLETLEYPQCIPMLERYIEKSKLPLDRGPLLMDLSLRILNLEASYKDLEDSTASDTTSRSALEALKPAILHLDDATQDFATFFSHHQGEALHDLNEEQLAFYTTPPLTPFSRRAYEPLKLSEKDFFPPSNNLALLDLTPKTRDLSVPDLADSREGVRVCAEMLRALYATRNRGVVDALNGFAVNAGNDLVPMVPAISDVRRGGRLNPNRVRAKMLSEEMVEGLVKAFFEWPFRPQTWELSVVDAAPGGMEAREAEGDVEEVAGDEK